MESQNEITVVQCWLDRYVDSKSSVEIEFDRLGKYHANIRKFTSWKVIYNDLSIRDTWHLIVDTLNRNHQHPTSKTRKSKALRTGSGPIKLSYPIDDGNLKQADGTRPSMKSAGLD